MAKILVIKDRNGGFHTVQSDIEKLKTEILRISKCSLAERREREKIIGLSQQLDYLEELLSAFEKDQKEKFD